MKEYSVEVKIKGTMNLLFNKPVPPITEASTKKKDKDYTQEWRKKVSYDEKGLVIIPAMNIEACIRDAGKKFIKSGKTTISRDLCQNVICREITNPIFFDGKTFTEEDIADRAWVFTMNVKQGKDMVWRTRAMIPMGWECSFILDIMDDSITAKKLEEVLVLAGHEMGLGDWRPSSPKPGRFGTFEVVKFKVLK